MVVKPVTARGPKKAAAVGKNRSKRKNFLILPILNRRISLCGLSALDLGNRAQVKPVEKAHFGAIFDSAPEQYKDSFTTKSKCVYVECEDGELDDSKIRTYDIMFRFLFNFHSAENPIFFSFGVVGTQVRTFSVKTRKVFSQGTERFDLSSIPYSLGKDIAPDQIKAYHAIVSKSIARDRKALLILQRLNLFFSKEEIEDRIIDLAIALEALIPGTTELVYRFSLYLSYIVESNPLLRESVFDLFKKLYEMRSAIVHGVEAKPKTKEVVQQNIGMIKKYALKAVNYYIFYLATSSDTSDGWDAHISKLVIAGGPRLITELERT